MRVRSELVSQEATCTVESVACTQESCLAVSTPYRYMATGFSYLFSTAFVLVFLALGFVHPIHEGLLDELGVVYDVRGNVAVDRENRSSVVNVFATGDAVMGASLVVKAIASGRKVAECVHQMLIEEKD